MKSKILKILVKALKLISKIPIKVLPIIIIIGLLALGIGLGIGLGAGDGEGNGNTRVENVQDEAAKVENDAIQTEVQENETNNNEDAYEGAILRLNVVESDYFYNNERISLEDFILKIESIDSLVTVEVKDDNASLKAYNKLIDLLEEKNISYVEK